MMNDHKSRVLITGAAGQIGSELADLLAERHGRDNVVLTDIVRTDGEAAASGPFEILDVTDRAAVGVVFKKYRIGTVYHLAAVLSATGEKVPQKAWEVNIKGLTNVLEASRELGVSRVFSPSSIAVFGPATPRHDTPQETVLDPKTIYGVSKVAGELLADYYVAKFGLDVRGCRFPGIISHKTLPGGGTTDYAVAIFYDAVRHGRYTCFLGEDTRLPMMYMPDCLKCVVDLMAADFDKLRHHSGFNVAAMSFTPGELAAEIRKHRPGFVCEYQPDFRQAIADSWPASIDDTAARREWGWKPDYDLARMTEDMLAVLGRRLAGETGAA